jgi:cytochrome d ubiquinol oxidase subunit I
VAELGRQPWIIYNYLKTVDAQSPVSLYQVVSSFLAIMVVYGIIFGYYYFYYFFKAILIGPEPGTDKLDQAFFYMSPVIGDKETKNKK